MWPKKRTWKTCLPATGSRCKSRAASTMGCSLTSLRKTIDISIDPFTGRNPSYCFVDFHTAEDAQKALENLPGQDLRGRPIKLNYHTRKKHSQSQRDGKYVYDRWKSSDKSASRWIAPHQQGRRLYVGGLPRIPWQSEVNSRMRDLFREWPIEAVSKIISPHSSIQKKTGEHHYCFVDLPSPEIAETAARALNGTIGPHGGAYKVTVAANSYPGKVVREQFGGVCPDSTANKEPPARDLQSNWRTVRSDR